MKDKIIISIISSITVLGTLAIIFDFLLSIEQKPKSVTDIKEVMINGELYRKVEKGE